MRQRKKRSVLRRADGSQCRRIRRHLIIVCDENGDSHRSGGVMGGSIGATGLDTILQIDVQCRCITRDRLVFRTESGLSETK